MQRKIHNQTIFVAALSVYLGLLIVGAPPQILAQQAIYQAQQSDAPDKSKTSSIPLQDDDSCQFTFAQIIKFIVENSNEKSQFHFSLNANFANQQVVNFQILVAEGDANIVNYLRSCVSTYQKNQSLTAINLEKPSDKDLLEFKKAFEKAVTNLFPLSNSSVDIKADQTEIVFETDIKLVNSQAAKDYFNFQERNLADVLKIEKQFPAKTSKAKLENVIFKNTQVSFKDSQVFIVVRLPRAGLDSLLKADEKAN